MPLTRLAADAFGVVTLCLVGLLFLLGLICIVYTFYFRSHVRRQNFVQLSYFSGPSVIRIVFILFGIWWGLGEIIRLGLFRGDGRVLDSLSIKWQETICKCYIVFNLGFAEPCLFLTLIFLLRAPLQKIESGVLSQKWNVKTVGYVLVYCAPVFVIQLIITLAGPRLNKGQSSLRQLPRYFTATSFLTQDDDDNDFSLCTYPLLSTILLGLFSIVLTTYLFWLGRRILKLVINKGLQKRVYTLIFSVSSFHPLRVILLGLSVLSKPQHFLFEALVFLSFLALISCAGVCIFVLVYCPIADSLALGSVQDLERRGSFLDDQNDTISLVANESHLEDSVGISPSRNSNASTKRGSISFRTMGKDESSAGGPFVELSLFSPSHDATPSGPPPPLLGWPMRFPVTS